MSSDWRKALYCYGDILVDPQVEENKDDIFLIISYNDHGDDFLYVETKSGEKFEYGYWCNRRYEPDYDKLDEPCYADRYLRKPKLFKKLDGKCSISNDLYFKFDRCIQNDYRTLTPSNPQWEFDWMIEDLEKAYASGIIYDKAKYRKVMYDYLCKNKIDTKENRKKLKKAHFTSRVNGIDGIAGKRKAGSFISGDHINFVVKNGKYIKLSSFTKEYDDGDEWGVSSFYLDTDQFRK